MSPTSSFSSGLFSSLLSSSFLSMMGATRALLLYLLSVSVFILLTYTVLAVSSGSGGISSRLDSFAGSLLSSLFLPSEFVSLSQILGRAGFPPDLLLLNHCWHLLCCCLLRFLLLLYLVKCPLDLFPLLYHPCHPFH